MHRSAKQKVRSGPKRIRPGMPIPTTPSPFHHKDHKYGVSTSNRILNSTGITKESNSKYFEEGLSISQCGYQPSMALVFASLLGDKRNVHLVFLSQSTLIAPCSMRNQIIYNGRAFNDILIDPFISSHSLINLFLH